MHHEVRRLLARLASREEESSSGERGVWRNPRPAPAADSPR
jgi:hypothetical protein